MLCLTGAAAGAATLFEQDATTSIDKGIEWLATAGAYNNPSSAGQAAGLTLLALLEKRPGADLDAAPQGYSGASETDQGRMRKTVAYIIGQVNSVPFDLSYRDGQNIMALSLYLRTGGLDRGQHADLPAALPYTVLGALNAMFDRIKSYQRASGYWCYGPSFQNCDDSSTTQFVMAGLAGLRAVYSDVGKPWADAARLTDLNAMAAKARQAYQTNGTLSLTSAACGNLGGDERAHGYNVGNTPSLQQTGSGVWIQLAGGADVNDASVQGYLKWIRNRYRYSDLASAGAGWPSYWYYMWSTSKALLFIRNSGVAVAPGNITGNNMGTLPAADAPACNQRQLHRDPATDARIALFGAGGAGYYLGQPKDFYYDFAYEVMRRQQASGQYTDAFGSSSWNIYSRQAYALLILQRSVGGGCIDSDQDGVCDTDEGGGEEPVQALYCDADFDGIIEYSDIAAIGKLINGTYK
ncbi:MAG: hypothetical protein NDI84_15345, partial [Steroidobacteraceae bacterium]|nr:hypothetical protein [Steroidobacteraceae bacterium]